MKIEIILLGFIGLVFLVDFIMNSRKKPSIDNVVNQIDGAEPIKKNNPRWFLKIIEPISYILKRKKNFTMYILSIPVIKVLIHFFLYRWVDEEIDLDELFSELEEAKKHDENTPVEYYDLAFHIEGVFWMELSLFIPAFILVTLVAWFFNDKIKAR